MKVFSVGAKNDEGEIIEVSVKLTNKGVTILKPHQFRRPFNKAEVRALRHLLTLCLHNTPNGEEVETYEETISWTED